MRVQFICELHNKHLEPQEGQGPYLVPRFTEKDKGLTYTATWNFDLSDMCCPDAIDITGKLCSRHWVVAAIG